MKFIFIALLLLSFNTFACENLNNLEKKYANKLSTWLGNKSEFSKNLFKAKCVLDKELQLVSKLHKKIIVGLIANSYEYEENKKNDYHSF